MLSRIGSPKKSGFTLIELLVVVAIMTVLLTLAASSASNMLDSINMRDAIQNIQSQFENARQTASTKNAIIIVRIYQEKDEFGEERWRAIEFGVPDLSLNPAAPNFQNPEVNEFEPNIKPLTPITRLPSGYIFHPSPTYSTLIADGQDALHAGESEDAGGNKRKYKSFLVLPDNRTNLPTDINWTLTIVKETDYKEAGLPSNYATLELDPSTARMRVYRP